MTVRGTVRSAYGPSSAERDQVPFLAPSKNNLRNLRLFLLISTYGLKQGENCRVIYVYGQICRLRSPLIQALFLALKVPSDVFCFTVNINGQLTNLNGCGKIIWKKDVIRC